jgi:uncharacterized protein (TIGR03435 family)
MGESAMLLQAQATRPRFDVTSVKPRSAVDGPQTASRVGRLEMPNDTAWSVIRFAYDLDTDAQVIGPLPDWAYTEGWAISAKSADSIPNDQLHLMTQSLLEDRFGLVAKWEERPLPHLEVVRAREDGQLEPNIQALELREQCADPEVRARMPPPGGGGQGGCGPAATGLMRMISELTGQIVVDKSGLKIVAYRIFSLPGGLTSMNQRMPPAAKPRADVDAVRQAVNDQLGLKLQASRAPVRVLVITSIRRPTPN